MGEAWLRRVWRMVGLWGPLLVWLGVIYFVSDQPRAAVPAFGVWDLLVKKGAHFGAYALLYLLARRPLGDGWQPLLLVLLYAVSDELHQRFVPGRDGNVLDVVIDTAGGVAAYWLVRWRKGAGASMPPPGSSVDS